MLVRSRLLAQSSAKRETPKCPRPKLRFLIGIARVGCLNPTASTEFMERARWHRTDVRNLGSYWASWFPFTPHRKKDSCRMPFDTAQTALPDLPLRGPRQPDLQRTWLVADSCIPGPRHHANSHSTQPERVPRPRCDVSPTFRRHCDFLDVLTNRCTGDSRLPVQQFSQVSQPHLNEFPCVSSAQSDRLRLHATDPGLVPQSMEDKWFVYYEEPHLFIHRSWTGQPVYRLTLNSTPEEAQVAEALWSKDLATMADADLNYQAQLVDFLLSNLLRQDLRSSS